MTDPKTEYERRRVDALAVDEKLDTWSAVFGHGRVVLLVLVIILTVRAYTNKTPQPHGLVIAMGLVFVGFLIAQSIVDRRRARARAKAAHYARGIDRIDGKWLAFESKGLRFADPQHPYAKDLDVIGDGSLFQLVDSTRTAQGESTLAQWLLFPSAPGAVEERRRSVQALAPELDAREGLVVAGVEGDAPRVDERRIVEWAEGPDLFTLPLPVRIATFVLPLVTMPAIALAWMGIIPLYWVIGLLIVHTVIVGRTRPGVGKVAHLSEITEKSLTLLLPMLEAASTMPTPTPRLKELRDALAGAADGTRSLKRRVTLFQSRQNLLVVLFVPIAFWDIHAAFFLQAWQRKYAKLLRKWFEALGELEALSSFATYTYEHPNDTWPELVEGSLHFEGKAIGHPLLADDKCVRNDVALHGPGTALLVTGSNMSGKSTLLRAVGLNAVLALAGLPVRATQLRLSGLQVATVMRVSDSLQEGASFFLAEVKRLKRVVDLAHESSTLFLLDEILQGTNTRERSLGARGVIAHLLRTGAMGLVSTHDLSLAKLGEGLGKRLEYAHFTDQVTGGEMTFDYRMKPGIVQTSNALRLMRAVGLDVEVPADETTPP